MAAPIVQDAERMQEMKEFVASKAGVKGLVDNGIKKVPPMFIHSPEIRGTYEDGAGTGLQVPIIDIQDVSIPSSRRSIIVNEVREAAETWGFFRLVNHGVPVSLMDEVIHVAKKFNDLSVEEKKKYYWSGNREKQKVWYGSNLDIYSAKAATWRDGFHVLFAGGVNPEDDLPEVCREAMLEYRKKVTEVSEVVFELLSEALGLAPGYLKSLNCSIDQYLLANYYPACPEPELTLAALNHTDTCFLTVLMNDNVTGMQVRYENKWVNVDPVRGSFGVHIGDLLQLISNDKFKSVEHRVVANKDGPRVSVAFFLNGGHFSDTRYGPIKEILSEENPAIYREVSVKDYMAHVYTKLFEERALSHFMLPHL